MGRWFGEREQVKNSVDVLKLGAGIIWIDESHLVNMFVRSGMHEVAVAGHIKGAGSDGQIPVVRQRQSFLPPFQRKTQTSLMFVGLLSTINSTQSTLSSPSNVLF